ncbi:restriction endonuclease subunit S [Leptospira levettii]|uniref:restriction endonuclease subunit S n=1 Tax=Leptospira levettii TaxID=2023178 RepID=UPI00223D1366|nr:restriction endonuclease subunit S [Leptospira levettii]
MKEIQAEKARLVAEGKVKKSEALSAVTEEEKPFEIPKSWEWVRLGVVTINLDGQRRPISKENRTKGTIPYYGASGIVDYVADWIFDEKLVLIGEDGAKWGAGENTAFLVDGKTWVNNHAHVVRAERKVLSDEFLVNILVGKDLSEYITGITVPKLNQYKLNRIPLPLPPLAEQKRIVEKIDELFALCGELERLKQSKDTNRKALHQSVITQMLEANSQESFQKHFQFLTTHFQELYSVKENVKELRKAVLQLAVMGKLVEQDPNDQPASDLLKEIQAEKARLVAEGKIKKSEALQVVKDEEKPFAIPKGWEWVRLGEVGEIIGGFAFKSQSFLEKGSYQVIRLGNIRPNFIRLNENPVFISKEIANETQDFSIKDSDILITMTGTRAKRDYLYSAMFTEKEYERKSLFVNQRVGLIRSARLSIFINLIIKDDRLMNRVFASSTGSANQANIGINSLREWPLPLPPLAEQKRIVEKVDQLLALCDELEDRIGMAEEKRGEILEGMVRV